MMRILSLSLFFLLFLFFVPAAGEAQSPFQAPPQQEKQEGRERQEKDIFFPGDILPAPVKEGLNKARAGIFLLQAQVRDKTAAYARRIQESPWGRAFWSYLGLAFLYGVIHALGPGHGKVFVGTYFLARKGSPLQAVAASSLMSFLHVLTATALILVVYFIIQSGGVGSVEQAGSSMQRLSALLICFVGISLAWMSGRKAFAPREKDNFADQDHGVEQRGLLSLGAAVGLVPCPGAALILFFSITLNILPAGLVAMLFLAAGLAVTTSAVALAALATRKALASASSRFISASPRLYHVPAFLGALVIALLGLILFFNPLAVP